MGGRFSRRRKVKQHQFTNAGAAGAFTTASLGESLLGSYTAGLDEHDIALQFEGGTVLKRFWIQGSLIDKPLFIDILSYLAAPELITCTEICAVWYQCADTAHLWDALDGIVGLGDISMGRWDYRCRHHRMRLTREEKRRHRAHMAGMEMVEEREKRFRGNSNGEITKIKKNAEIAGGVVKKKMFGCVVKQPSSLHVPKEKWIEVSEDQKKGDRSVSV